MTITLLFFPRVPVHVAYYNSLFQSDRTGQAKREYRENSTGLETVPGTITDWRHDLACQIT